MGHGNHRKPTLRARQTGPWVTLAPKGRVAKHNNIVAIVAATKAR